MVQRIVALIVSLSVFPVFPASPAHAEDFDEHFLAAACAQYVTGGNLGRGRGSIVKTAEGVAVQHQGNLLRDVVLYCNVDVEVSNFFNLFQLVAEDNTETGNVSATLFQEDLDNDAPPVPLVSVQTTDQPGTQRPSTFTDLTLSEIPHHYYIEVVIHRENLEDVVRVYSVSLRDVL